MTQDTRTFYGPHPCAFCGKKIVKASHHQGGESFDAPDGPIYPNTEWQRHDCGPFTLEGDAIFRAMLQATSDISAGKVPQIAEPWDAMCSLTYDRAQAALAELRAALAAARADGQQDREGREIADLLFLANDFGWCSDGTFSASMHPTHARTLHARLSAYAARAAVAQETK